MSGMDVSLAHLEDLACTVAVEAGRLVVDERPDALGVARTKSTDVDIVTVMDQRSEQLLHSRLEEMRPRDGVLGEEGAARPSESGLTWVLDPIDGTVNYLYRYPAYAVSVAACTGDVRTPGAWRPVAAAVYNPASDELFHAHEGGGARMRVAGTDAPLHVSRERTLGHALLGTGFGYDPAVREQQGRLLTTVLPKVRDIRRGGSAALDLCSIAAGRLDCYYESGLNAWDMAGGALVVTEAGGVLLGRGDGPAGPDLVVAGPADLAGELHALVGP